MRNTFRRNEYMDTVSRNACPVCQSGRNNDSLLLRIQRLKFSLDETVLFLDAYPNNAEALSFYHAMLDKLNSLIDEYESTYGPLTAYGNKSKNSWDWIKGPWPWEYNFGN